MRVLAIQPFVLGDGINTHSGGKSRAARLLAQYLIGQGHTVALLPFPEILGTPVSFSIGDGLVTRVMPTIAFPRPSEALASMQSAVRARPSPGVRSHIPLRVLAITALRRAIESFTPDVIHNHQTVSIFPDLYQTLAHRVPVLLTHTHAVGNRLGLYDHIVFPSEYQRKLLQEHQDLPRQTSVIYYPVHPAYLRAQAATERSDIVFAGFLSERKGLDILLRAYASDQALNRIRLHVCGDGPMRSDYERMVADRSVNATFHGKVSPEILCDLLSRAVLMVTPSREESFGVVYQESLCCGTPFIGYAPTVRELEQLWSMKVGVAFDAAVQTPGDLATAIHQTLASDLTRRTYRHELATKARDHFTLARYGAEYVRVYENLRR